MFFDLDKEARIGKGNKEKIASGEDRWIVNIWTIRVETKEKIVLRRIWDPSVQKEVGGKCRGAEVEDVGRANVYTLVKRWHGGDFTCVIVVRVQIARDHTLRRQYTCVTTRSIVPAKHGATIILRGFTVINAVPEMTSSAFSKMTIRLVLLCLIVTCNGEYISFIFLYFVQC